MSRQIVPLLQAAHATFGGLLLLTFVFQAMTGWRNRRGRLSGAPLDFSSVRRHRKLGPLLAWLFPAAYVAGLVTVVVDKADWLRYPAHLLIGTLLVLAVAVTAVLARRIQGRVSIWRTRHAAVGSVALALFAAQAVLGLGILF